MKFYYYLSSRNRKVCISVRNNLVEKMRETIWRSRLSEGTRSAPYAVSPLYHISPLLLFYLFYDFPFFLSYNYNIL